MASNFCALQNLIAASLLSAYFAAPVFAEPPGANWLDVGARVEFDLIQASTPASSMWRTGKIVKVNRDMNSYEVELPDGSKRTIINAPKWIKPATGGGEADQAFTSKKISTAVTVASSARQQKEGAEAKLQSSASKPLAPNMPRSQGAIPDGAWVCHKISGSIDLLLGKLEVKGGSYRGIESQGGFTPFGKDADGNVTMPAGLVGLPTGWKVMRITYHGGDSRHERIEIHCRNASGSYEIIEGVRH
ncbi:MAG: hypothetical protein IT342_02115 [Candidatus Melainabacteria bacterium]|nr:hypothetical protein [Candidatus Melainabacteria bacterium]